MEKFKSISYFGIMDQCDTKIDLHKYIQVSCALYLEDYLMGDYHMVLWTSVTQ